MNRIKWPKEAEAKDRALRAAAGLRSCPEWQAVCEHLIPYNLSECHFNLREGDLRDPECARLQGVAQLFNDLLTLSTDAGNALRAKPQTPTARPR